MAGFAHVPVLPKEVVAGLNIKEDGIYLDATFGRGGHSRLILEKLGPEGRLYALDRDPEAIKAAAEISDPRFRIEKACFSELLEVCESLGINGRVDGILLDIGVSSPQLDDAARGFSFEHDGPLDMRMDPGAAVSAATLINGASQEELTRIFRDYGEERFAGKVAAAIVRDREKTPFTRTVQLASLMQRVIPGKPGPKHKATRCFQALRIAVNSELDELSRALNAAAEVLAADGRLCVISFHSLEDRIVKNFIRDLSRGRTVPNGVPLTFEETEKMRLATAKLESMSGAVKATAAEIAENVRSRSATLRIARRLART